MGECVGRGLGREGGQCQQCHWLWANTWTLNVLLNGPVEGFSARATVDANFFKFFLNDILKLSYCM